VNDKKKKKKLICEKYENSHFIKFYGVNLREREMTTNYNIVGYGSKLDTKLYYNYWELFIFPHLKAHNIWSFIKLSYNMLGN